MRRDNILDCSAMALALVACVVASGTARAQAAPALPNAIPDDADASTARPLLFSGDRRRAGQDDPFITLPRGETGADLPSGRRASRTDNDIAPRGETVQERDRPGYDALGIKAGGFTLYPALSLRQGYTSNVFRQPTGRDDAFVTARAAMLAESNWSRHRAVIDGFIEQDAFVTYSTEASTTYRVHAGGEFDLRARDSISVDLSHERIALDRGAVGEVIQTREPIRYEQSSAQVQGRIGRGRVSGQMRLAYDYSDFDDSESPAGVPIAGERRDNHNYEIAGQVNYRIGAGRQAFVSATHNWRRFPFRQTPQRDVNILEVVGGLESEITPLIRGRLGVGYLHANFFGVGQRSRGSLAIDANLSYLFTELTTINLRARRRINNVGNTNSSAAIVTAARLSADHELLRNVIITPGVSYEHADFLDVDAKSQLYNADISARWLISNRLNASITASARKRNAEGFVANRDYSAVSVTAGITFQL